METPSEPTPEQVEELDRRLSECIRQAAASIASADVLLLSTGAGWSKDSGLCTYEDIGATYMSVRPVVVSVSVCC